MLGSLRSCLGGIPSHRLTQTTSKHTFHNQLTSLNAFKMLSGTYRNYYYHTRKERTTIQKVQEVRQNRSKYSKKHIWPRESHSHPPKKGDNQTWTFRVKEVRFAIRGINWYARMLKNLHLQDAIDWIAAIPVNRLQKIFELLTDAQKDVIAMGADPSRIYIKALFPEYKRGIKHMVFHKGESQWGFGIMTAHRHTVVLVLEQLNPGEFFHKLHIMKKVPRSLSNDMRVALHERRVGPEAVREWWPYLSAHTRYYHHHDMKRLDGDREFNYYEERANFLRKYTANVRRRKNEMLGARSLEGKFVQNIVKEHAQKVASRRKDFRRKAEELIENEADLTSRLHHSNVRKYAAKILEERREESEKLTSQLIKDVETYVPGGIVATETARQVRKSSKEVAKRTSVRVGRMTSLLKDTIKSGWNSLRSGKKED